jgi:K+/H+ antiporter YhaU regulatory subunit KhtT
MNVSPRAEDIIEENDVLVVIGDNERITRLEKKA